MLSRCRQPNVIRAGAEVFKARVDMVIGGRKIYRSRDTDVWCSVEVHFRELRVVRSEPGYVSLSRSDGSTRVNVDVWEGTLPRFEKLKDEIEWTLLSDEDSVTILFEGIPVSLERALETGSFGVGCTGGSDGLKRTLCNVFSWEK